MPPEPRKPIEELLEASAKARRAEFGVDPKMPNPMRARLHDEIARIGRKDEPERRSRWLGTWWPRIAIGAAMAALIIGAPVMWWHARQSTGDSFHLAMDGTRAAKEMNRLAVPSLPAQSAPQMQPELDKTLSDSASAAAAGASFADSSTGGGGTKSSEPAKAGEENSSALKKFAEVTIAPSPQAPGTQGLAADEKKSAEAQTPLLAEQKARLASETSKVDQEPAPKSSEEFRNGTSRPVIADSGSLGRKQKMEGANVRQQFSQTSANQALRRDAKLQQAANVLNNFQVEQDGRQIRVVDADGSTYTGRIERLAQSDARNLEKQNYAAPSSRAVPAKPVRGTDESANNEFYFHATGYNGSLKKSLVFEGNYIVAVSPQQKAPDATASTNGEQMPARIVGTAKIHGEPPVRVDALSVAPK
jgi:hypothetical protein